MHRDMSTAVWVNNDVKEAMGAQFSGLTQERNSLTAHKLKRKKNRKIKKCNKKQYTLEIPVYLKVK